MVTKVQGGMIMSDISNIYSNIGVGFGPSKVEKVQKFNAVLIRPALKQSKRNPVDMEK